jgi:UDP-N-acetylmuramoyl-tripeptide--D-alanyl-D-alanine ligase
VLFGDADHADLRLTECRSLMLDDGTPGVEGCVNGRLRFTLRMPGRHNALNALAAIAVGRRFGVPEEDAVEALAALPGPEMRMERVAEGGVTIFNDAYNASPESMRAALATFAELEPDPARRVLVLGDMLELGSHGGELHREIAGFIAEACPARRVVTIGPLSLMIAEALERLMPDAEIRMHSELTDPLAARIAMRFREGESVLVKGSRRIGLERVVASWCDHARGLARTGPA